jgi:fibronectin type 3 domain-containing protein
MIDLRRKIKNFGPLEFLVLSSLLYVVVMLIWTATTRSEVLQKASDIKSNHKMVVELINSEINKCSSNIEDKTSWGENCNSSWDSSKIVNYIINNFKLNNPYNTKKPLIQTSQDPRIQAEGKAGQSTDKGIIFVSSNNFEVEAGSEWIIGTCVKSPCVAAGNNELVSAYR